MVVLLEYTCYNYDPTFYHACNSVADCVNRGSMQQNSFFSHNLLGLQQQAKTALILKWVYPLMTGCLS